MTPLSPTALEEAAKALYREFENRPLYAQTQMNGVIANECTTAAITAYLAQREKEGWVMVPKIILDAQATSTTPVLAEFIDARSIAERG